MHNIADSEVSVSTGKYNVYNYNAIRNIHISINRESGLSVAYHQVGNLRLKTITLSSAHSLYSGFWNILLIKDFIKYWYNNARQNT